MSDVNLNLPELGQDMKHIHPEHMATCASFTIHPLACCMVPPHGKNLLLHYSLVCQKYFVSNYQTFCKFRKDFNWAKQKSDQKSPPSSPYFVPCNDAADYQFNFFVNILDDIGKTYSQLYTNVSEVQFGLNN